MNRDEIQAITLEVLRTVAPEADLAAIDPATSFRDQFEIDSVDYLNFVLALE
jgi:acyl carrier protein